MTTATRRDLIFTPPPTPNGALHVGHVAGPYLRADLNMRLLRLLGGEAEHCSHIDNYQTYVARKAAELGRETEEFRAAMVREIEADYDSLGIEFGQRIDNMTVDYQRYFRGALAELLAHRQAVVRPEFVGPESGQSAVEAYVTGHCPSCLQHAFANVCENCGRPLEVSDMIAPIEDATGAEHFLRGESGGTPTVLLITSQDMAWVREWLHGLSVDDRFVTDLARKLGEHTVTLTLRSAYGFAVAEGRVVNAWIEIFFAHAYSVGQSLGLPADCSLDDIRDVVVRVPQIPRISYYFGVDNSYYYCVLFPVMARLLGLTLLLPEAVKANRFLQLAGRKVSSSKNNVVWASDLSKAAPQRQVRAALTASCPEYSARDFRPDIVEGDRSNGVASPADSGVLAAPVTDVGRRLREILVELSEPSRFSVADVGNRLTRALELADSSRSDEVGGQELREMVGATRAALNI